MYLNRSYQTKAKNFSLISVSLLAHLDMTTFARAACNFPSAGRKFKFPNPTGTICRRGVSITPPLLRKFLAAKAGVFKNYPTKIDFLFGTWLCRANGNHRHGFLQTAQAQC